MFPLSILSKNKIVCVISPPRSSSVALLRSFEARGDFKIMHEPFVCPFDRIYFPEETKDWFKQDSLETYQEVKEEIFKQAEVSNVFVKEMSFAIRDFILQDEDFIKNPDVFFVFLIRDPHHSIVSFYLKLASAFDSVTPDNLSQLTSYKDLYTMYTKIKNSGFHQPLVVDSGILCNQPKKTMKKLCQNLNIVFDSAALSWKDLGSHFDGAKQWRECKYKDHVNYWHEDAIRSVCFGKPKEYDLDESEKPTFSEIKNQAHKKICKKVYGVNKEYYDLLFKYKI